jgi:alpha-N-arabinofuranosidase
VCICRSERYSLAPLACAWLVFSLLLLAADCLAGNALIDIRVDRLGPAVNPHMYGIFLEEINHGVDGGLYAELIRNRGFEDSRPPEGYTLRNGKWVDAHGFDSGFTRYGYTADRVPFWSLVAEGGAKGTMNLQTSGGITEASSYCLRLDIEDAAAGRIGVANAGFFGIGLRQGQSYALSLYARSTEGFAGSLKARLEDVSGAA